MTFTRDRLEALRRVRYLREDTELRLFKNKKDSDLTKPVVGLGGTLNDEEHRQPVYAQEKEEERTKINLDLDRALGEDENTTLVSEQLPPRFTKPWQNQDTARALKTNAIFVVENDPSVKTPEQVWDGVKVQNIGVLTRAQRMFSQKGILKLFKQVLDQHGTAGTMEEQTKLSLGRHVTDEEEAEKASNLAYEAMGAADTHASNAEILEKMKALEPEMMGRIVVKLGKEHLDNIIDRAREETIEACEEEEIADNESFRSAADRDLESHANDIFGARKMEEAVGYDAMMETATRSARVVSRTDSRLVAEDITNGLTKLMDKAPATTKRKMRLRLSKGNISGAAVALKKELPLELSHVSEDDLTAWLQGEVDKAQAEGDTEPMFLTTLKEHEGYMSNLDALLTECEGTDDEDVL